MDQKEATTRPGRPPGFIEDPLLNIDLPAEDLLDILNGLMSSGLVPSEADGGSWLRIFASREQEVDILDIRMKAHDQFIVKPPLDHDRNKIYPVLTRLEIINRIRSKTIININYLTLLNEISNNDRILVLNTDQTIWNNLKSISLYRHHAQHKGSKVVELIPVETSSSTISNSGTDMIQRTLLVEPTSDTDSKTIVLSEVPLLNPNDSKSPHGEEYRWFILYDIAGNIHPLTVRYWLNGSVVTREQYEQYTQMAIDRATGLVPELAKLSSSYM